jgi:thioredoxin 1
MKVNYFFATWCQPCSMLSPIFESVSNQTEGVEFEKINVDVDSDRASKYGIRSIPTLILEKDGQIVQRKVGMITEDQLKTLIEENR